jgi:hypothetical protein
VNTYRVLITDPGRRFRAGEVGVELPNDYPEKYDHKLKLHDEGPTPDFPLLRSLVEGRVFYFRKDEVKRVP